MGGGDVGDPVGAPSQELPGPGVPVTVTGESEQVIGSNTRDRIYLRCQCNTPPKPCTKRFTFL